MKTLAQVFVTDDEEAFFNECIVSLYLKLSLS